jgi:hypothetical protein
MAENTGSTTVGAFANISSYAPVDSGEPILRNEQEPSLPGAQFVHHIDRAIYKCCAVDDSIKDMNVAETNEYVVNIRGQKLHVKSYCPPTPPRCLILSLHGYSAHNNSPWKPILGHEFVKQNIAYIVFDFHGHGYSDGDRVLVEDKNHLTDDCMSVLAALYSTARSGSLRYFNDFNLKENGFTCPFFINGESLGGLITLAASFEIQQLRQGEGRWFNILRDCDLLRASICSNFLGCIPLCPAIHLDKPPAIVVNILKYCVVPCFPASELPGCIAQPPLDLRFMFYDDFIKYAEKDNIKSDPPGMCSVSIDICASIVDSFPH